VLGLGEAAADRLPFPVPQDVQLEGLAPVIAPEDAEQMGRTDRLPPVYRLDDIPALEPQRPVLGGANHQHPVVGAEILAEVGVEGSQLEIGSLQAGIDLENRTQVLSSFTGDLTEAMAAFAEKRPARFTDG